MKKKFVALLLTVLLVLSCAPFGMAYTTEEMQAATHLNQLGLFAGSGTNPDGSPNFDLDAKPTRVQGIVMLLALMGERSKATSTYTSPFTDVPSWAKNYVNYAYSKKYTGGVSATRFGTNNPVTSNQYLTFVLAAMGYSSRTDFNWKDPFTLSDSLGITNGEYDASSKFSRGDMCIISNNALTAKIKGSNKTLMDKLIEQGVIKPEAKPETVSQQVIYDKDGYKATVTGLKKEEDGDVKLNLLLENTTATDITFQVRNVSINGYMIDPTFSCDVAAGKKANDGIYFPSWKMDDYAFTKIADFEFSFRIFSDDDSVDVDTELIQVKTSAADTYQYIFDDKGSVVYNDNGVKIVYKKIDSSDSYDTNVVLFVENNTDNFLTLQSRDASINGYMIDPTFSADVSPHKRILGELSFPNYKLDENNITKIGELDTKFYICFNDNIGASITTDIIKIPVESGAIEDVETDPSPTPVPMPSPTPNPTPKPFNLDGEWIQSNRGDPDVMYHRAFISDGTIEIYWYDPVEKASYLYWAGTIVAPDKQSDKFSWNSQNDTEKTSTALLASGNPTKTFTYENGEIKYEASAFGVTAPFYLKKVK